MRAKGKIAVVSGAACLGLIALGWRLAAPPANEDHVATVRRSSPPAEAFVAPAVAPEAAAPAPPPFDHGAAIRAAFAELERQRDALLDEWRELLAGLHHEARVNAFVEGLTSLGMKGELAYDLVAGDSAVDQVSALLYETVVDRPALTESLLQDVGDFQGEVQVAFRNLLTQGGVADEEIAERIAELRVASMPLSHTLFDALLADALEAAQNDSLRFAANWVASDLLSAAVLDVGRSLGLLAEDEGAVSEFVLRTGTDVLIGTALDEATDFSEEIRETVEGHLRRIELGWQNALQETLDEILARHRAGCLSALEVE